MKLDPQDQRGLVILMRILRDTKLTASDWTQLPDAPVDREAWAAYRQALRDFPATWEPSEIVNFPLAPGEQNAPIVEEAPAVEE